MKKLCVIGDPVLHSKSPLLHNAMLREMALDGDYTYDCQLVPARDLKDWLAQAPHLGYVGFNATMPHKEALVPLMDGLDEDAKLYGAVNTVCMKDGKLYGYNTDGRGFLASLEEGGFRASGKRAVLLGAGGAAKAIALKLVQAGVSALTVCNRTAAKAAALCAHAPGVMTPAGFDPDTLTRAAAEADLLVNATNLGMADTHAQFESLSFLEALPAAAPVYDVIYHPPETELLRRARALGHPAMNGLGMLLYQAIFALEHFIGVEIPAAPMAEKLKKLL